MRVKIPRVIVTFHTTAAAMAMEKACRNRDFPGRLIPVPREITAGCGMAWSVLPKDRSLAEQAAEEAGLELEGIYELVI